MHIWTHRGNPGPENTLEGFSQAWIDGITHFETDIHCTNDGVLVLAHDSDISRLTGVKREIKDLSWKELQNYKIDGQYDWTTLDELHEQFDQARISIDIKSDHALEPFLRWAHEKDLSQYVVGSFSTVRVNRVRKTYPHLTTALTSREILCAAAGFGRLLPAHSGERVAMVPPHFKGVKILTQSFVSFCSQHAIDINVWTINSPTELEQINHLGINGIITDTYHQFIG
jgi:glycerophosphoryl diester phosphodiesterase